MPPAAGRNIMIHDVHPFISEIPRPVVRQEKKKRDYIVVVVVDDPFERYTTHL